MLAHLALFVFLDQEMHLAFCLWTGRWSVWPHDVFALIIFQTAICGFGEDSAGDW